MQFNREISLPQKGSLLLFGPRMVGKTTLLERGNYALTYNLLDPNLELKLRSHPGRLLDDITTLSAGTRIFIDEIQRVPDLLNVVQIGIDKYRLDFVLSGSSARKLRRGGGNLLGGRALYRRLYPLTMKEMDDRFDFKKTLCIGSLPKIVTDAQTDLQIAYDYLYSYINTYIREEIQAEAVVRNLGAFQRFLPVAAQSNAQTIEFSNISRECSIPASTVKEYYQVLEDTLLGFFLWPFDRNERKKARPKFYFFDTGVVRALQGSLHSEISSKEKGFLFETWLINELIRINEYMGKYLEISFWRERNHEVDILLQKASKPVAGIEIKTGKSKMRPATKKRFEMRFPGIPLYTVGNSLATKEEVLSYPDFLGWFRSI